MKIASIVLALAGIAVLAVLGWRRLATVAPSVVDGAAATADSSPAHPSLLFGRVVTVDGAAFEGRLRWGGDEEAFWSDFFNGFESENVWAARVPTERLPAQSDPIEIFGLRIAERQRPRELGRRFLARFGDIARVESSGADVRVTLKSGTTSVLDRFEASDFDDGLRVWDAGRGVVDLDSARIRSVELLAGPASSAAPDRLHGTVRTAHAEFTGFLQWDREECLGGDELDGETADGEIGLRFEAIRSIERRGRDASRVTLDDGRVLDLSGTPEVGEENRGVYVDDPRYGRVLVSWEAFERADFDPPGAEGGGPAYDDFPPGRPLAGRVAARDGRVRSGRLVFDLDESETTETLDAPARGVDYLIPFERVATIVLADGEAGAQRSVRVILRGGEELALERDGDLGDGNAGVLVFVDGGERPDYLPWSEVARIDLDPARADGP